MAKIGLVQRILALVKGGDEAKLVRFETKLGKYLAKQVAMRKEAIEGLKDKIVDAQDKLNEDSLNIQLDRINSSDNIEAYVVDYVRNVKRDISLVKELEAQIASLEEEIEAFNDAAKAIDEAEVKTTAAA